MTSDVRSWLSNLLRFGSSGKGLPTWWAVVMGGMSGSSYPKVDAEGLVAGAGALGRTAGRLEGRAVEFQRLAIGVAANMPGAGAMMSATLVGVGQDTRESARSLREGSEALREQATQVDYAQKSMEVTALVTLWTVAQLVWAVASTGGVSAALVPGVLAGGRRSVGELLGELAAALRSGAVFGAVQDLAVQLSQLGRYREGLDVASLLLAGVGGAAGGLGDVAGHSLTDRLPTPALLRRVAGGTVGGVIGGEAGTVVSTAWQGGPWDASAFAFAAAAGAGTGVLGGALHHYVQLKHAALQHTPGDAAPASYALDHPAPRVDGDRPRTGPPPTVDGAAEGAGSVPAAHGPSERTAPVYERGDWRSREPNWPQAVANAQNHPLVREVQHLPPDRLHTWWNALPETHRQHLDLDVNTVLAPAHRPAPAARFPEPAELVKVRAAFAGELARHRLTTPHTTPDHLLDNPHPHPRNHPPTNDDTTRKAFLHAAGLQATAADRRLFGLPAGMLSRVPDTVRAPVPSGMDWASSGPSSGPASATAHHETPPGPAGRKRPSVSVTMEEHTAPKTPDGSTQHKRVRFAEPISEVPTVIAAGPAESGLDQRPTEFIGRIPDYTFEASTASEVILVNGMKITIPKRRLADFRNEQLMGRLQYDADGRAHAVRFSRRSDGRSFDWNLPDTGTKRTYQPGSSGPVFGVDMPVPKAPPEAAKNFRWTVTVDKAAPGRRMALFSTPDGTVLHRKPYDEPLWAYLARQDREAASSSNISRTRFIQRIPANRPFRATMEGNAVVAPRTARFVLKSDQEPFLPNAKATGRLIPGEGGMHTVEFTDEEGYKLDFPLEERSERTAKPGQGILEFAPNVRFSVPKRPPGQPVDFEWTLRVTGHPFERRVQALWPDGRLHSEFPYDEPAWVWDERQDAEARAKAPALEAASARPVSDEQTVRPRSAARVRAVESATPATIKALTDLATSLRMSGNEALPVGTPYELLRHALPAGATLDDLHRAAATVLTHRPGQELTVHRVKLAHTLNGFLADPVHAHAPWRPQAAHYLNFLSFYLLPVTAEYLDVLHVLHGINPRADGTGPDANIRTHVDALITATRPSVTQPTGVDRARFVAKATALPRPLTLASLAELTPRAEHAEATGSGAEPTREGPAPGGGHAAAPAPADGPPTDGRDTAPDTTRADAIAYAVELMTNRGLVFAAGIPHQQDPRVLDVAAHYYHSFKATEGQLPAGSDGVGIAKEAARARVDALIPRLDSRLPFSPERTADLVAKWLRTEPKATSARARVTLTFREYLQKETGYTAYSTPATSKDDHRIHPVFLAARDALRRANARLSGADVANLLDVPARNLVNWENRAAASHGKPRPAAGPDGPAGGPARTSRTSEGTTPSPAPPHVRLTERAGFTAHAALKIWNGSVDKGQRSKVPPDMGPVVEQLANWALHPKDRPAGQAGGPVFLESRLVEYRRSWSVPNRHGRTAWQEIRDALGMNLGELTEPEPPARPERPEADPRPAADQAAAPSAAPAEHPLFIEYEPARAGADDAPLDQPDEAAEEPAGSARQDEPAGPPTADRPEAVPPPPNAPRITLTDAEGRKAHAALKIWNGTVEKGLQSKVPMGMRQVVEQLANRAQLRRHGITDQAGGSRAHMTMLLGYQRSWTTPNPHGKTAWAAIQESLGRDLGKLKRPGVRPSSKAHPADAQPAAEPAPVPVAAPVPAPATEPATEPVPAPAAAPTAEPAPVPAAEPAPDSVFRGTPTIDAPVGEASGGLALPGGGIPGVLPLESSDRPSPAELPGAQERAEAAPATAADPTPRDLAELFRSLFGDDEPDDGEGSEVHPPAPDPDPNPDPNPDPDVIMSDAAEEGRHDDALLNEWLNLEAEDTAQPHRTVEEFTGSEFTSPGVGPYDPDELLAFVMADVPADGPDITEMDWTTAFDAPFPLVDLPTEEGEWPWPA
ncbi:hypothetical protein [Kitasatospora sp. NPDC093102]|uniref:hypothetical protein n=1 Tax=Kitasatospora sp. NPDC093102 TaxID=3155069 RepID=UPI00343C7DD2